jgi:hypothetical protein
MAAILISYPSPIIRVPLDRSHFLVAAIAGWAKQQQQDSIEYFREESRILRKQVNGALGRIELGGIHSIQGALKNLGHSVSRGTVANVLKEHGIEPAPKRCGRTNWRDRIGSTAAAKASG